MKSECKYSFLEAKTKLEAFCAYQERCQFEIDQKLKIWAFDYEDRQRLISDLISNQFVDEERFASAFVSGKYRIKKWGRIKIKSQLFQKHISTYSIQKALLEIDADEYWNNLIHLTERKYFELRKINDKWEKKLKITRFLQSKGYESDLIQDALELVIATEQ